MRPNSNRVFGMFALLLSLAVSRGAHADGGYRLSGPFVRGNLAMYFVHGASREGPVPLTLQEALARSTVRVYELGNVNELAIENFGDEQVFVQAGDIVKGGRQDRALTASLILPPRSGRVPLAAFCVEQGRWSGRANQDPSQFSSAAESVPSREAKLALKSAPLSARAAPPISATAPAKVARAEGAAADAASARLAEVEAVQVGQSRVWDEVSRIQHHLTNALASPVAAPESRTSLALALENDRLRTARDTLIEEGAANDKGQAAADEAATVAAQEPDVIGYVFAINGKLNSGDIYPSAALFRKMWPKLLKAAAIEAISARGNTPTDLTLPAFLRHAMPKAPETTDQTPPTLDAAKEFLAGAEAGEPSTWKPDEHVELAIRESEHALMFESRGPGGLWGHRNYLAK